MADLANCQCGNPLPCDTCCNDHSIRLFSCSGVWVDYEVEPSPEKSLKFDGMQSEPYSIHVRKFYLQIPKADPPPSRGALIQFGPLASRITEITTYGCDAIITAIRFFFPCTTEVSVTRCLESGYCDVPEDNKTDLGKFDIHFTKGDADSDQGDDNHRLRRDIRGYFVVDPPFEWTNEHYIRDGGDTWQVIKERNREMVDRATYVELEQVGDNCGC